MALMQRNMQEKSLTRTGFFDTNADESLLVPTVGGTCVYRPRYSQSRSNFTPWQTLSMPAYSTSAEWTEQEKVDLLVNILHGAVADLPNYLMGLVMERSLVPRWTDIPLPQGRSLHDCQITFEDMRKRLPSQQGFARPSGPPYVHIAPAIPAARSVSATDPPPRRQPTLLPRNTESPLLSVTNGESPTFARAAGPDALGDLPKKRGRPKKAEAEERDRLLALQGKVHQPKRRSIKKARSSLGPVEAESSLTGAHSPNLSYALTSTQRELTSEEEITPGGRKRRRRTQEESPSHMQPDVRSNASVEADISFLETSRDTEIIADPGSPTDRFMAGGRTDRERTSAGSTWSGRPHPESEAHDLSQPGEGYH